MKQYQRRDGNDTVSKFSSNTLNFNNIQPLKVNNIETNDFLLPIGIESGRIGTEADDDINDNLSSFLDLDFEEIQDRIDEIIETPT